MANFSRSARQVDLPVLIPTDPSELGDMLYRESYDWAVVLDFLDKVATKQGTLLDTVSTSKIVQAHWLEADHE